MIICQYWCVIITNVPTNANVTNRVGVCVCGEEMKGNSVFSVHFFCEAETAF